MLTFMLCIGFEPYFSRKSRIFYAVGLVAAGILADKKRELFDIITLIIETVLMCIYSRRESSWISDSIYEKNTLIIDYSNDIICSSR